MQPPDLLFSLKSYAKLKIKFISPSNACVPFTKNKGGIQKFMETGDTC